MIIIIIARKVFNPINVKWMCSKKHMRADKMKEKSIPKKKRWGNLKPNSSRWSWVLTQPIPPWWGMYRYYFFLLLINRFVCVCVFRDMRFLGWGYELCHRYYGFSWFDIVYIYNNCNELVDISLNSSFYWSILFLFTGKIIVDVETSFFLVIRCTYNEGDR